MRCEQCGQPLYLERHEERDVWYRLNDDGTISEAVDRVAFEDVRSAQITDVVCECAERKMVCPYDYIEGKVVKVK
jgi:hypothetical protein